MDVDPDERIEIGWYVMLAPLLIICRCLIIFLDMHAWDREVCALIYRDLAFANIEF